jgi:hypothetical protein
MWMKYYSFSHEVKIISLTFAIKKAFAKEKVHHVIGEREWKNETPELVLEV